MSFLSFFSEVRSELGKCIWPTRKQVVNFTLIVIAIAAAIGIILGLFDNGFFTLIKALREWLKTR